MNIGIQILRAVACLLVVFGHAPAKVTGNLNQHLYSHHIGVDIFFIISGFVMATTMSTHHLGVRGAATFLIRRFIRIWPLYALVSLCFAYELSLFCSGTTCSGVNWEYLGRSLLLLPISSHGKEFVSPFFGDGVFTDPILGVGWTLEFEMYFYLVVAILICTKLKNAFAPAIIFAIPVYLTIMDAPWTPFTSMISSPLLYEFAFGYWVCGVHRNYPELFLRLAPTLLPVGFVLILIAMTGQGNNIWYRNMPRMAVEFAGGIKINRVFAYGIPAAILFCAFLGFENIFAIKNKLSIFAKTVGDSSYMLYLIHIPIFVALPAILSPEHWSSFIVYFGLPIFSSIYLHLKFEKPLLSFFNSLASKIGFSLKY